MTDIRGLKRELAALRERIGPQDSGFPNTNQLPEDLLRRVMVQAQQRHQDAPEAPPDPFLEDDLQAELQRQRANNRVIKK